MRSVHEEFDVQSSWLIRGKYLIYFVSWVAFVWPDLLPADETAA